MNGPPDDDPGQPGSHTATDAWQQFEARIRQRRLDRLVAERERTTASGDAAAEAGLAEQDPAWQPRPGPVVRAPGDAVVRPVTAPVPPARPPAWAGAAVVALAALLVVLLSWPLLTRSRPEAVAPAAPRDASGQARPDAAGMQMAGSQASDDEPAIVVARGDLPASVSPTTPAPTPTPVRRPAPPDDAGRAAVPPTDRRESPADAVPAPARDAMHTVAARADGGERSTAAAARARGTDEAADDSSVAVTQIQRTLRRYGTAYDALDARAVRVVWPGVDEEALARAFAGLASQDLDFERCRVQMSGSTTAEATCTGHATYVLKAGERTPRTEPRRWSFGLRRRGEAWTIAQVEVRR